MHRVAIAPARRASSVPGRNRQMLAHATTGAHRIFPYARTRSVVGERRVAGDRRVRRPLGHGGRFVRERERPRCFPQPERCILGDATGVDRLGDVVRIGRSWRGSHGWGGCRPDPRFRRLAPDPSVRTPKRRGNRGPAASSTSTTSSRRDGSRDKSRRSTVESRASLALSRPRRISLVCTAVVRWHRSRTERQRRDERPPTGGAVQRT